MYKVVLKATTMAHNLIKSVVTDGDLVVDATLGNGNDTIFLSGLTPNGKVYAFDIQDEAVVKFKKMIADENINNVEVINDGHENIDRYVHDKVKVIMFNLGYLPGADKSITTKKETTLIALEKSLELLMPGGLMTVAAYIGHDEGAKEAEAVLDLIKSLDSKKYSVMQISFLNRNNAPFLVVIEKNDNCHVNK